MIDLHIHTNASSDGQHSPREIFEMAREKRMRALAFADHNSVENVEEGSRLGAEYGIEFIPCMELNTLYRGLDLHILAYYIDPRSSALRYWMDEIHGKKVEQARRRTEKLNELGFHFSEDDLNSFAEGRLPTGKSFLEAILSRPENRKDPRLWPYIDGDRSGSPYVNFYRDYLRGGKPAFIAMEDVSTLAAIQRIGRLGGVSILAHPSDTGEENILSLARSGLEGLEAYSPYHTPGEQEAFRVLAEAHGLLVTAGSDFHGKKIKPDVELGQVSGDRYELVERLRDRRKELK
jgi:predicted metal-dependent phosphoesterase TrpH